MGEELRVVARVRGRYQYALERGRGVLLAMLWRVVTFGVKGEA